MSGSDAETLKSFLVDIGYRVDQPSKVKFVEGLASITKQVAALVTAVEAAALGVVAAVTRMASGMEQLYYASQRTGSSARDIQAFGFAISQMGGTAEGAVQSLEGMARFLRSSPAAGNLIQSLGVNLRDANGQMRGTEELLVDLGEKFRQMPFYRANAYANAMGIDERTLMALTQGVGRFSAVYQDLYRRAGLNSRQAGIDARDFMRETRTLGAAFDILSQKVGAALEKRMGGDIRTFREFIVRNFDTITRIITTAADVVLRVADAITRLATRAGQAFNELVGWFDSLSPRAKTLIETLGGIGAAWLALNMKFLASPAGIILAAGAAILALYDDYETWKSGGKSLIDWSKWEPDIKAAMTGIGQVVDWIGKATAGTNFWRDAMEVFAVYVAGKWLSTLIGAFTGAGSAIGGFRLGLMGLAAYVGAQAGNKLADIDEHPENYGAVGRFIQNMRHGLGTDKNVEAHPGVAYILRKLGYLPQLDQGGAVTQPFGGADTDPNTGQPRGPTPAPGPGSTGAMRYLMQHGGWSLGQAAGIVANLQEESGLNPRSQGDYSEKTGRYEAQGIAQWHGDRQAKIEAQFHKPLSQMSVEEQLDAVTWEMLQGQEQDAGQAIRSTNDPNLAAAYMNTLNERSADPGGAYTKRRTALAEQLQGRYLAQTVPTGSMAGGGVNVTNNTTINVTGGRDPHGTATIIGHEVASQNQKLVRNTAGAVH